MFSISSRSTYLSALKRFTGGLELVGPVAAGHVGPPPLSGTAALPGGRRVCVWRISAGTPWRAQPLLWRGHDSHIQGGNLCVDTTMAIFL